jgi:putative endopeptidase
MTRARVWAIALIAAGAPIALAPSVPTAQAPTGAASGQPTPAAPAAPSPTNVTLADVGLEAGSLDRSIDPCIDFYQFACGGWIQSNPIPADRARWTRGSELDERNQLALRSLLENATKGIGVDAGTKRIGDFYASCMDDAASERAGLAPFRQLLARTQGVKDAQSWLAALAELHKLGVFVVWDNHARADLKSSTGHVIYLDAAGLGLPDRDYYVRPELADKLDGYTVHVGKMLGLLAAQGATLDPAAAAAVVAIETELARLTRTAVERRDIAAAYNPTDLKALARQVKSVDWTAYWKALGVAPGKKLVLGTPRYFAALDKLRARFKPAQWASYFTFHLIERFAFALPRAYDDETFELQKLLTGVEKQRDRSRRCVEHTSIALGELLGQHYVTKYFPGGARHDASKLIEEIARVMGEHIAGLPWMADATRQLALAKLGKLVPMVGFPERWRTYDYAITRDDFAGNALRSAAFETHRQLSRAGKPVDRGEWQINTYQVGAYYDASANHAVVPAGILQPPFFGPDRGVAANLGGIGMIIGHELTHAFDDRGAQFDADGNLRNWWHEDDLARFLDRRSCVADLYSTFEVLPGKFIQGALTVSENIADMGGVKMAFQAYRALRKDAPRTYVADGYTEDQQFFIAAGQAWCARERPAETERRLGVHPYSPPKFRVYGALRGLPEFAEAFRCVAGTPMRPAKTCTVW